MQHNLPGIETMLPAVKRLAQQIKLYLYTTSIEPSTDIEITLNKNCVIRFCGNCTDIFVSEKTLYLPIMTLEKLAGLQVHLQSVGLPYVFEHEALHLLDIAWYNKHQLEWAESFLEIRADQIEQLLAKQGY